MPQTFRDVEFEIEDRPHNVMIPCVCPACGTTMAPKYLTSAFLGYKGNDFRIFALSPNCCEKVFLVLTKPLEKHPNDARTSYQYLAHYPNLIPCVLPDSLDFSPRFKELYAQAHTAELNNHIELAGSGYRNALEVLIKDYAIKKLSKDESVVANKNLWKAIEDYLPTLQLKNSADMIRLLGNDFTHYERRYSEFGFDQLKKFLQIFIHTVDANISSMEPPISMRRNQEE